VHTDSERRGREGEQLELTPFPPGGSAYVERIVKSDRADHDP
jgi:hypothetical protein